MRRLNIFVAAGIFISFLIHGIMGALGLAGASSSGSVKIVGWVCMAFTGVHIVIVTIMTCQTLYAGKRSGAGYFKDNIVFWIRRISGFLILIPLIAHILIFNPPDPGVYRLREFTAGRMMSQILLIAAIAIHIITVLKPLTIALGLKNRKAVTADVIFIISIILLLFSLAFIIYYMRWMAL